MRGGRRYPGLNLASVPLSDQVLQGTDCVVLVTDHSAYDYAWIASQAPLIVDTRNAFRGMKDSHIIQA